MKNERKFYRCDKCGNLVGFVEKAGANIICCGEPMVELFPNTVDAATEKHLPSLAREGNKIKAAVGSVAHPMTPEHHITWIAVAEENRTTRVKLQVTDPPEAEFYIYSDSVTAYAYCNLHGLWAADL